MDLNTYKTIIHKTAVYPTEVKSFGIAYCYLGLLGETNELAQALEDYLNAECEKKDVIKEIGDVYWYVTALCKELNINLNDILETNHTPSFDGVLEELVVDFNYGAVPSLISLSESIKKFYRDNKNIDTTEVIKILIPFFQQINLIITNLGYSQNDILLINYNKLIKRRSTNTLHGDGDNREEENDVQTT